MPESASPSPPDDQPAPELNDAAVGALFGAGGSAMQVPQTEVVLRHEGVELARATLPPGEYVIGRALEAAIRAETPLISRQHARLTINYDHLLIEDLGSSNGTFVAEKGVTECTRLFPNQAIRLGDVQLEIRRQRIASTAGMNLAPAQAAIRQLIPDEVLAHKRYAIGQQVARGGMGAILDAQQAAMKRRVAMKVMLESNEAGDVARFVDEAQITGQLEHPNIVPVHELGVDENDQLFYTMKFVRGITLKKVIELLARGVAETVKKYPLPALLTIFQKACDAIAFAHSKGVIHRDLKPENIMLGDFGEVLVMDWGLAKVMGIATGGHRAVDAGSRGIDGAMPSSTPHDIIASARGSAPEFGNTMTGTILGTPTYMAPEQARGEVETMDQRADIYSLGAILFEILHLRPPLTGNDPWAIVAKARCGEVEWKVGTPLRGVQGERSEEVASKRGRLGEASLPPSLLAVCRQALALDPARRYQHVADLQADLAAYQNGFATSAEKAGAWKQFTLFVRRHKAASIGAAAALLLGTTLGTKAVVEGRRAERALADLKKNAPAMLALAESEAIAQRFESELEKVDVALRLDPDLLPAYWRRAWCLVALGRFADAATALQTATQHDRSHASQFIGILPQIQQIAALPDDTARYAPENIASVFDFLNAHDLRGEAGALIEHLRLGNDKRFALAKERLVAICGSAAGLSQNPAGLIQLGFAQSKLRSLEQVRGLPLDILRADTANLESVEPLRGLRLVDLSLGSNHALKDLSPLAGMPLRNLSLFACSSVTDLSPLHGMPLESLSLDGSGVSDLAPLAGLPLHHLYLGYAADFRPLAGAPLETLSVNAGGITADFSPLVGMPLKTISGTGSATSDLTPLLRIPTLERLATNAPPNRLAPLRKHPGLKLINYQQKGYRPVAEVWAELDAKKANGGK